jgi:hypothetical protein
MMLPNVWLWNMVDEFLYQFQSFAQYRSKLTTKSPEEIELLKKCEKVSERGERVRAQELVEAQEGGGKCDGFVGFEGLDVAVAKGLQGDCAGSEL